MKKITKEEAEAAKKLIELYEEQVLEELRQRIPKFGDTVRCLCGAVGRYIGKGQVVYISAMSNEILRDLIDMEASWETDSKNIIDDKELIQFIKYNNWIE